MTVASSAGSRPTFVANAMCTRFRAHGKTDVCRAVAATNAGAYTFVCVCVCVSVCLSACVFVLMYEECLAMSVCLSPSVYSY